MMVIMVITRAKPWTDPRVTFHKIVIRPAKWVTMQWFLFGVHPYYKPKLDLLSLF